MQLITATAASAFLNIRVQRLYELVRLGVIPHVKLGKRQLRFDPEALQVWVKNGGAAKNCPGAPGEASDFRSP